MKLENEKLVNVRGGAIGIKAALIVGIGGLIAFVAGIIDGYMNPIKCNARKSR